MEPKLTYCWLVLNRMVVLTDRMSLVSAMCSLEIRNSFDSFALGGYVAMRTMKRLIYSHLGIFQITPLRNAVESSHACAVNCFLKYIMETVVYGISCGEACPGTCTRYLIRTLVAAHELLLLVLPYELSQIRFLMA